MGRADLWPKASLAFYGKLFAVREGPWATCCVAKQQFHSINDLAHSSWHVVAEGSYCSNGWRVWSGIFQSSEKSEMVKEIVMNYDLIPAKNLTNKGNTPKNNVELRWIRTPLRWQQAGGQTEGEVAVKQDQDTSHRLKGNHHRIKKKPYVAHSSKTIFSSDGAAWADFQDRWHFQKPLKKNFQKC